MNHCHVVSLEMAKRLRVAGFPQNCWFSWYVNKDGACVLYPSAEGMSFDTVCAAPLLSEVMEQMRDDEPVAYCGPEGWNVSMEGGGLPPEYAGDGPDSAAKLWLKLKEGK